MNFWGSLKQMSFALAPMADVTDAACRAIYAKYGKPDLLFTEFVSADGLMHPVARPKLLRDLEYGENERPIVAQIFSSRSDKIEGAAKLCAQLGFDGVDINMGCPDRAIEKQGAGAALIKNPTLVGQLYDAACKSGLPISIKTRLGYSKVDWNWIKFLIDLKPAALTFHLRTRAEMSKVPAHWEVAGEIAKLADGSGIIILGNGDVKDLKDAREKAEKYNLDSVMVGRAALGNPWWFTECQPTPEGILKVLLEHTKLFEQKFSGIKSFALMKKFFKAYIAEISDHKILLEKLMKAENASEVEVVIKSML